jgi:hypothetical protein
MGFDVRKIPNFFSKMKNTKPFVAADLSADDHNILIINDLRASADKSDATKFSKREQIHKGLLIL